MQRLDFRRVASKIPDQFRRLCAFGNSNYRTLLFLTFVGRFATYENIPVEVFCSAANFGLIELSLALKLDVSIEPILVDQAIYVRCFSLPKDDEPISAEAYNKWYSEEHKQSSPTLWQVYLI